APARDIARKGAVGEGRAAGIVKDPAALDGRRIARKGAVGEGRAAVDVGDPAASACLSVADGAAAQRGGGGLAAVEVEAAAELLAVEDTLRRVVAGRADGDLLAAEVELVLVVGAVGNQHRVARTRGGEGGGDGRVAAGHLEVGGAR